MSDVILFIFSPDIYDKNLKNAYRKKYLNRETCKIIIK